MRFSDRKIAKYVERFGVFRGLRLFWKIRRSKKGDVVSIRLPGLPEPVYLRRQSSDLMVFEEVFVDRQYDWAHNLTCISTIIDAGANIGLSALFFLQKYPRARIFCLEPEAANFALMKRNLSGYNNITLLQMALWGEKSLLDIADAGAASWNFEIIAGDGSRGAVGGLSVEDLMYERGLTQVDLLKIDIEGSEREVFSRAARWLPGVRYMIVEIHEDMRPGATDIVTSAAKDSGLVWHKQSAQYFFSRHG